MKLFAILCLTSLAAAGVKREADPAADPDADPQVLSGHRPVAVSAPQCHSVPELKCTPRQVESPRKVCHQEYDEVVDTTITEHCEEVITTTCQQVSHKSILSKQVIGHDSKIVATNVAASAPVTVHQGAPVAGHQGPAHAVVGAATHHHGKREAEPEADAEAGVHVPVAAHHAAVIGPHPAPAAEVHETPLEISEPVCHSVPVKKCENVPTHVPRRVGRTVCAVHVDVTTIEDCEEVITTQCSQTQQSVAHASNVVGHDTRVGPAAVVAVNEHAAHGAPVVGHPSPSVAHVGPAAVHAAPHAAVHAAPHAAVHTSHAAVAAPAVVARRLPHHG